MLESIKEAAPSSQSIKILEKQVLGLLKVCRDDSRSLVVELLGVVHGVGAGITNKLYVTEFKEAVEKERDRKISNSPDILRITSQLLQDFESLTHRNGHADNTNGIQVLPEMQQISLDESYELFYACPKMQYVVDYTAAAATAPNNIPALITGETGTGKELIARLFHKKGLRNHEAFIATNLSEGSETLVESTLFGHEKGAFTGADHRRIGLLELAHKGVFFIDEIGDLSDAVQIKLLRVLQEKKFSRLGSNGVIDVNVQFVFATKHNLEELVRKGKMRDDFYHRINVATIELPALRERTDKTMLVATLMKLHLPDAILSSDAHEVIERYPFPGNVRELVHLLQAAAIHARVSHSGEMNKLLITAEHVLKASRGVRDFNSEKKS